MEMLFSPARTVLVADAMKPIRYLVTTLLHQAGYATLEAEDGFTALRFLREGRADVALLDVLLPDIGGLEVLLEVACLPNPVPVLLFTGLGCITDGADAIGKGAIDYLTKPMRNRDLLEAIDRALEMC